jgi:maltose O-acetyltransferase
MADRNLLSKLLGWLPARLYYFLRESAHLEYVDRVKELYKIHASVRIGYGTTVAGSGQIEIGQDSYIGYNSFVCADPAGTQIVIGKHCSLSHNIHIRTQIHVRKKHYKDELAAPITGADIIIGDYVWIGANVYISGGVKIGENSIIGANSIVTHDVPPNTIFGGVPARLIRHKSDYLD